MVAINRAGKPTGRRRLAVTIASVVVLAVMLALAGCARGGGRDDVSMQDAVKELQARPDIEQTMTKYNQLMTDLKAALTTAGVTGTWKSIRGADSGACNDFGDEGARTLTAETRSTPSWSSTGISEADWPQALEILKRLAAAAGFTTMEVPHDEPRSHDLFIQGPYGAVLSFGTEVNTSMSIRSGCHRLPGQPINRDHPETSP